MTRVAERAGVTRRAAYLHFDSRESLLAALFDFVASSEGLEDSIARVFAAPHAVAALEEWARHLARYHPRLIAIDRAVERVYQLDPDAAAHRRRVIAAQLDTCQKLAAWLAQDNALAQGWSVETARDMLWALISTDRIDGLLHERGWRQDQLAQGLALLFRAAFTAPGQQRVDPPNQD